MSAHVHGPIVRFRTRAFTLVEISVVAVIFVILAGIVLVSFLAGKHRFVSTDAYVQVQQDARQALDAMSRELRSAGTVTPGVNQLQLQFQLPLGYNLAGCPNAVCWGAIDQAGASHQGWFVRYSVNGTRQLIREVCSAACAPGNIQSTRVLANNVAQATFTFLAPPTNTVTATIQVQINSAQLPTGSMSTGATPLSTTIKLRN